MEGLILAREFQIIKDSYELKHKIVFGGTDEEAKADLLARILLRCKSFYEAKNETVRILLKIKKCEHLTRKFENDFTFDQALEFYNVYLKM